MSSVIKNKIMDTKEFNELPEHEKRMLIAQDVIDQLKSKLIVARHRKFFWNKKIINLVEQSNTPVDLRPLLSNHKCEVCVKGALFVADIARNNNFMYFTISDRIIADKLEYFDQTQLNMIELAYEGFSCNHLGVKLFNGNFSNLGSLCRNYYFKNFKKSNIKKMILIMQNIIDNEGTFKP